jgi:heme a synthase
MNSLIPHQKNWSRFLFYFWLYTLLVILWGAWVRISHSGNGCGDHWPLCGGEFIPSGQDSKTWVEYTHRLMSGAYGLIVLFIFFKWKKLAQGRFIKSLNWSLLFLMISEAVIGALLVKGQLVTENDSFLRMIAMIFHQLNSFLLTGVTYLFYLLVKTGPDRNFKLQHKNLLLLFLILPITGAIASLSVTLFPSLSLWQGVLDDFSSHPHLFVRLRVLHPFLAVLITGGFMMWLYLKGFTRLALEFTFAMGIGLVTLLTLSPLYLKLLHLFVAHWLWAKLLQLFVNFPDSSNR